MSEWLVSVGVAGGNHLWQSTAFAAVAWAVTLLLRKNQARVRYGVWLVASVKFLLPFSLLIGLGGMLPRPQRPVVTMPAYSAVDQVALPFDELPAISAAETHVLEARHGAPGVAAVLAAVWLCGVVVVLVVWAGRWRAVTKSLRRAVESENGREANILRRLEAEMGMRRPVRLMLSRESMEPGMFGIWRPVLIWPEQLSERLDDEHIEAIVAHELMHARRRDNLTAALHMMVEAAFWFHPMVWWMERRMVEEREHACDEAVVEMGSRPGVYAESLLKACRFCVESPLACVAGITGADLAARVRSIMTLRSETLGLWRKVALAGLAVAAIAGPMAFGVVRMIPMYGQVLKATGPLPGFEAVTIKPASPDERGMGFNLQGRHFRTINTTVGDLVRYAYDVQSRQVEGLPAWAETEKYDVVGVAEGSEKEEPKWKPMVQKLLAERFGFSFHSSTKEMPVYELQVAKNGPKLTKSGSDTEQGDLMISRSASGPGSTIHGKSQTMTGLAKLLETTQFDRPVVDRTGLSGYFDFEITFLSDHFKGKPISPPVEDEPNAPPGIFTAIQEQLGLKLEPAKGPTEIMVIDHVEKPVLDVAESVPPAARTMPTATLAEVQPVRLAPVAQVQAKGRGSIGDANQPSFEVTSIKRIDQNKGNASGLSGFYSYPGGRVLLGNADLSMLFYFAYGVKPYQITNAPDWASSERYEIIAIPPDSSPSRSQKIAPFKIQPTEEQRLMIQSVLRDRYHLKFQTETRQGKVYILTRDTRPLLLEPPKDSDLDWKGGVITKQGGVVDGEAFGINISMANLSNVLSQNLGLPVLDRTGLTERYDFHLEPIDPENHDFSSAAFNAMDRLGLRLKRATGPVETIVIDHIERPSEN